MLLLRDVMCVCVCVCDIHIEITWHLVSICMCKLFVLVTKVPCEFGFSYFFILLCGDDIINVMNCFTGQQLARACHIRCVLHYMASV